MPTEDEHELPPATPRQQIVALFRKFASPPERNTSPQMMLDELSTLMDELDGRRGDTPSCLRPVEPEADDYPMVKNWVVVTEIKSFMGKDGRRAHIKASHVSPDLKRASEVYEGDISVFFDVAEPDAPRLGQSLTVPVFGQRRPLPDN